MLSTASQMGWFSSRGRSGAVCVRVQGLQLEAGVTRRQLAERLHRRSLRHGKEALDLAAEVVEIGVEKRWAQTR